jgi:hypothetical protein
LFLANVFSLKHPFFKIHFCKVWGNFSKYSINVAILSRAAWEFRQLAGRAFYLTENLNSVTTFFFFAEISGRLRQWEGMSCGYQSTHSTSQSQCGQSDHSTSQHSSTGQYSTPAATHSHSVASQTTALHSTAAQVSTAHLQQLTVTVLSVKPQHFTAQQHRSVSVQHTRTAASSHRVVS